MALTDRFRDAPGNQQGKAANWRSKVDLILDAIEASDPDGYALVLAAIKDADGWPHIRLSRELAEENIYVSYEAIRRYRQRRLWEQR